ncbi:GNAT family N-acetyltransferase [Nonomuraea fastidiosa]|jgi:GNAT superfamily N-acetyltransferase|uniref:GNAT family N-acetyltransferase n=1 Tax=Nonomuraea TaxID=83681 RepID=UPI003421CBB6
MTNLAEVLRDAQDGRFPPADGGVTLVPQPSPRDLGVLSFTAHAVVFADVDPAWIRERLPPGDLDAPLGPPFLQELAALTGRAAGNLDLLAVACPLPGSAPLALEELRDSGHPRVARARRYRDDVRVWVAPAQDDGPGGGVAGLLTVGRGVGGRWEVAIEVEPAHRGRGLGRLLAAAARHLAPAPVWAQVAPGNAASVRAFIAAGYAPVGAEVLLSPEP